MQAFLRDELVVFCRDAPPEFNEHQRDVFCVFSGTGVARLRQFLNEQENRNRPREPASPSHPSAGSEQDMMYADLDDPNIDSNGSTTPIINVDVHAQYLQGHTPIVPGPSTIPWAHNQSHPNATQTGAPLHFSQSAPATSGPVWVGGPPQLQHNQSQLAGMMGAAALDEIEVDGDEAFGEESEIMDQD